MFVHPRSPYTRVDALRSNRPVRVELDGVVLADSASPVMVFETGLPTRYYVSRTDVRFEHLVPTDTVTACPYKGMTSGYWSVRSGGACTRTWPGRTTFPPASSCPSPAWSPSTTRRSTRSSAASCLSARRRTSSERTEVHAEQRCSHPARAIFATAVTSPGRRIDVWHRTGGGPGR